MTWFMKWFSKKPVASKPKSQVRVPELPHMTMEDWQKDLNGITEFRVLYNNPKFQDMLRVLYTIRPRGQKVATMSPDYQLGFIAGYEQLMTTIFKLTEYPKVNTEPLEADFGADKLEEKE